MLFSQVFLTSFPSSCCSGIGRRVTGCFPPTRYLHHTAHYIFHPPPLSPALLISKIPTHTSCFPSPLPASSPQSDGSSESSVACQSPNLMSLFRANVSVPLHSSALLAASGNVSPSKHSPLTPVQPFSQSFMGQTTLKMGPHNFMWSRMKI